MCGSTCFERLSAHHQERTTALEASGFTVGAWRLERFWSWSGRPRPTTLLPPRSNRKTRGCYCSCKLLMMSGEASETCWATHKRQLINLRNCCILLVNLFESTAYSFQNFLQWWTAEIRYIYSTLNLIMNVISIRYSRSEPLHHGRSTCLVQ